MESVSLPFDFTSGTLSRPLRLFQILQKPSALRSPADLLDLTATLISTPLLRPFQHSDQLESLARAFCLQVLGRGETVYEAGDKSECFYIVIEGTVEIRKEGNMRVVMAGGDFGEPGEVDTRVETAVVKEAVRLMALPLTTYESMQRIFVRRQSEAIRVFLTSLEIFETLPKEQLDTLVAGAKIRTFTDMTFIVSQGQSVGGIYYIIAGGVRVMRNILLSDGRQETIGIDRLEAGDAIGDLAAITRQPVQYSALAQGKVNCLLLEKALLLELDKEHWHQLQVAAKPYPPDAQLQALHTQQQRWEQYKSSLVHDIKASKQLRISHTLDGYRSLTKPSK